MLVECQLYFTGACNYNHFCDRNGFIDTGATDGC
ncbi:hypothetical protein SAMN05216249_1343 [Acetitomaculum ruminis DSM 5522]|uniref:Uncharacterized protein n=1 Tax=Acetitomaculum ruminis DSM 5522 TaxID=1120918 RepID=A0A1I1APV1_9FIRM|nr:hypothetical protein SAMN05216249_1343 [Acetitomaculum ruminis DSM 5522]